MQPGGGGGPGCAAGGGPGRGVVGGRGAVYSGGHGGYGLLGLGDTNNRDVPTAVPGWGGVVAVEC